MPDNRPKTKEELHQKVMSALEREFEQVAFGRPYGLAAASYHCGMISADADAIILVGHTVTIKANNINLEQLFVLHESVELLVAGIAKPSKVERAIVKLDTIGVRAAHRPPDYIDLSLEVGLRLVGSHWQCEVYYPTTIGAKAYRAIGAALEILNEKDDQ